MNLRTSILADGTKQVLIHFVFREESRAPEKIACMPNCDLLHATATCDVPHQRSGEVQAVTCSACQNTPQYQEVKKRLEAALKDKEPK